MLVIHGLGKQLRPQLPLIGILAFRAVDIPRLLCRDEVRPPLFPAGKRVDVSFHSFLDFVNIDTTVIVAIKQQLSKKIPPVKAGRCKHKPRREEMSSTTMPCVVERSITYFQQGSIKIPAETGRASIREESR